MTFSEVFHFTAQVVLSLMILKIFVDFINTIVDKVVAKVSKGK